MCADVEVGRPLVNRRLKKILNMDFVVVSTLAVSDLAFSELVDFVVSDLVFSVHQFASPMVTRKTSESDVMPEATFSIPSSRSVRMPNSRARSRRMVAGAWSKMSR